MALSASGVTNGRGVIDRKNITPCGVVNSVVRSAQQVELQVKNKRAELRRVNSRPILAATLGPSNRSLSKKFRTRGNHVKHGSSLLSCSAGMPDTETEESVRHHSGSRGVYRQGGDDPYKSNCSTVGLSYACKFVYNDAKFVNERARNDIFLLSCGIRRWDARARQDVAILGLEFLKIDARAREDTEKIDRGVKEKAERLHHIGTKLKEKAQTRLKSVAEKHWNDGALKADLRRADLRAKQRAMEDALMALEFVKNIHNMMLSKMYNFPLNEKQDSVITGGNLMERIRLEKNGINLDFTEVSADRILAVEEAYWSIASALYDADGIDYTDPEDLELLVTTLIDLDAMDGKSSVSLLAECSSSPDVNTRKALANALAAAPSMWTLGNAGMGALQRLAEDSHPAIAAAASKAIYELKKQWEIAEGDSWRFTTNQDPPLEDSKPESDTVVDE